MKTLLTFLLCLITLTANSQMSKEEISTLLKEVNDLTLENNRLKRKIALYEKLANEQDVLIKLLEANCKYTIKPSEKKHTYHDTNYETHYPNQVFDRNVYIKGNLFLIIGKDTINLSSVFKQFSDSVCVIELPSI